MILMACYVAGIHIICVCVWGMGLGDREGPSGWLGEADCGGGSVFEQTAGLCGILKDIDIVFF